MSNATKIPTTDNGRAAASDANKRIRRKNRGNDFEDADYSSVSSDKLQSAIHAVTKRGCAIQFSYTRDGGAYCVRLVGDGDPYNEYVRPTEDFDLYLDGLIEDFEPGNA